MTQLKTKEERMAECLDAAWKTISKLPLAYFEDYYVPKPAVDNFIQMIRQEFVEDEKLYKKLNATIDGMLLLQEFTLQLQKQN